MANLIRNSEIVLATASLGIAATLLPGGRTAHSRFGIPINIEPHSIYKITKNSDLAKLIRITKAVIWDEAPMINRYCVEALDRSLQDIMNNNAPFGGKIMIMGGDFRQMLPVIEKGNRGKIILGCIVRSRLWATIKVLHLRQNMRSIHDHDFAQFLMRIGDGSEPTKEDDMIRMPAEIVIPWEGESSLPKLIHHTFPQLENHGWDASYMVERAILTPKNCDVHMLNDMIINGFPGDEHILLSFDEVEGDTHNLYQQEYLHTIALGHNAGKRAFLPRIKLKTTEGAGLPFVLIRKQFPVKLRFAITINKSQGQTIPNLGIYLPRHVFSHGQLYVALSRRVSRVPTRVLIKDGRVEGEEWEFSKNIVFKEILLSQT